MVNKVVVILIRTHILTSVRSLQVCADQEASSKSITHAMHAIYNDEFCETFLLLDVSNVFNSIKRYFYLHHVSIICPAITLCAENCCFVHSQLSVTGGNEIQFKQTNAAKWPSCNIYICHMNYSAVIDITNRVDKTTKIAAYAEDLTAAGKTIQLKHRWEKLCNLCQKLR